MNTQPLLSFFLLFVSSSTLASTVLYTDSHHPPGQQAASLKVVYLDGPEQWQKQYFGQLSANPQQAEQQAQRMIQSPQWVAQQQQLVSLYRDLVHAWQLGIKKIPAIVFDDQQVIYGTTDIRQALALRANARGGQ